MSSVTATAPPLDALDPRKLLAALRSFRKGDFSARLDLDQTGVGGEIAEVFNDIVELEEGLSTELRRVSHAVGKEGLINERAKVPGAVGKWATNVDAVNALIADFVQPVTEVSRVIGAVARGDLTHTMTLEVDGRPVKGEFQRTAKVVNTMVSQLDFFAGQVTRVVKEVGTEGKLGGQAEVNGALGTWKDLTDCVNQMAANLTGQVRNIADVTTGVAKGDLSKKITVDAKGEVLELKNTINTMVDQLGSFASEVTRVAKEVGTDGKLGGQADVKGVSGTWRDLTESVNQMAANLTGQVRNVVDVTTAVAKGDLSRKITVEVKGEFLALKNTINTMVDQLGSFASEVTRVAKEVGTDGKLGGQADVKGVSGTWKDLTESVNQMAANLTGQVRNIADVTTAVAKGDLSRKITVDVRGEFLELKSTINVMVDQLGSFASEVTRVAREVGSEGRLGGQAIVRGAAGTWKDLTDSVNQLAANLTTQMRNIAEVTTAVARGDLARKITVDVKGEFLELKSTINTMVDQLSSFASEVSRVAREVGTEGKLGGQAEVKGVAGTWKDLTDNVNSMAANLTNQVRGIAKIVTFVANGDLRRKLALDAKGEIATLEETINTMVDQLGSFAAEVSRVAREVGSEGKLGGQAVVRGVAGTWKDLTDNVNQLAVNLTTQVRAIAEVATAVAKGDLTRTVAVSAKGELASLMDSINEMIRNLKDTTQRNTEQDWLKTNLAKFTRMLQGQKDLKTVSKMILSEIAPLVKAQHAVFYVNESTNGGEAILGMAASYAYRERKHLAKRFGPGEGLIGQCAVERERILLTDVPGDYVQIGSGLGEAKPLNIVALPVLFEGVVKAVVELASFNRFSDINLIFLEQLTESIGIVLNTIAATMRTEDLLKQSQALTTELQTQQEELKQTNERLEEQAKTLRKSEEMLKNQQEELKQTNEELERQATTLRKSEEMLKNQQEELQQTNEELAEKARMLSDQKTEVENKNREVEIAKASLEGKAEQLALTSKYKSEFLANMSHELRTPLNSMLILSKLLADNAETNLTPKQVEFSETIHGAGADLLTLINDILDLSKIESGTVEVDVGELGLADLQSYVERTFRQVAADRALAFVIEPAPDLPPTMFTDSRRLQQVLKNLLSNAFKFTPVGRVDLRLGMARQGWTRGHEVLDAADGVIAFTVSDTGIGIPLGKQRIIFEAFQQADMTTSRKFGGTGLGLSISREIARMLGGEIRVKSVPDEGSTFTLFLPVIYKAPADTSKEAHPAGRPGNGNGGARADASQARLRAERAGPSASEARAPATPPALHPVPVPRIDVPDDRASIEPGDRVLLVIDDDVNFAKILLGMARERGYKGLVATLGDTGMSLARRFKPDAITLDLKLPDVEGWTVLDRLKHDPATRHIPVHVISVDDQPQLVLAMGAFAALEKPVSGAALAEAFGEIERMVDRRVKDLLIVEDDEVQRRAIVELIGDGDVRVTAVGTGEAALAALRTRPFDAMVLDLGLPDMTGIALIERIKSELKLERLPIIVYTGKELTEAEERDLKRLAETIIVKDVRSPERLLDETALFLHRIHANLPEKKRRMLDDVHRVDPVLAGRKVLVVDDDVRNIFALMSILERHKIEVVTAESGKAAIELVRTNDDIDVVLMDIMMPEMDGFDATRRIREMPGMATLPILALTAKAMKGDRDKCIAAGASDYITKPVDVDQLISLLRVWLYRKQDASAAARSRP